MKGSTVNTVSGTWPHLYGCRCRHITACVDLSIIRLGCSLTDVSIATRQYWSQYSAQKLPLFIAGMIFWWDSSHTLTWSRSTQPFPRYDITGLHVRTCKISIIYVGDDLAVECRLVNVGISQVWDIQVVGINGHVSNGQSWNFETSHVITNK